MAANASATTSKASSSSSSGIDSGGRKRITLPQVPQVSVTTPGTLTPEPARTAAVSAYCHQQGVVTLTCGTWGNVFRFLPPLSISDALLDEAFDVVAEAFAATA